MVKWLNLIAFYCVWSGSALFAKFPFRVCKNELFEPSHEIMALFVFCKLILQMRMRSHPVELDVWFLVGPFVYFHTAWMRRLAWAFTGRLCFSTIISRAGSFKQKFCALLVELQYFIVDWDRVLNGFLGFCMLKNLVDSFLHNFLHVLYLNACERLLCLWTNTDQAISSHNSGVV